MNGVLPVWVSYWDDEYEAVRLKLAFRIVRCRPKFFLDNRERCQKVLDTIDALFLAKG